MLTYFIEKMRISLFEKKNKSIYAEALPRTSDRTRAEQKVNKKIKARSEISTRPCRAESG